MKDLIKNQIEESAKKIHLEINQKISSNSAKNENSKQKIYRRYLKNLEKDEISLKALKSNERIKDSTLKAWISRWNRGIKMPKFKIKESKKEESSKNEKKS